MLVSRLPRLARPLLLLLLALALGLPAVARPLPVLAQGTAPAPTATPMPEEEEVASDALLAYFESEVLETEISDLLTTLAFYADATFDLGFTFTELEVTVTIAGTYEETDDGFLLTALTVDDEEADEPFEIEVLWDADDSLILVGGTGDMFYEGDIVLYAVDEADFPVMAMDEEMPITVGGPYVSHLVYGDEGEVVFYVLNLLDDGSASLSSDYLNLEPPVFEVGGWSDDGNGFVTVEITGTVEEEYDEPIVIALAVGDSGELYVGDIVLYPLVWLDSVLDEEDEVEILATYVAELVGDDADDTLLIYLTFAADGSFTLVDEDETNTVYGEWALDEERLTLNGLGDDDGDFPETLVLEFEFGDDGELILVDFPEDVFGEEGLTFYPLEEEGEE